MQEEVEQRSVTLIVNSSKFTGRVLKNAIAKYLAHLKNKSHGKSAVVSHGKMSVKQLAAQDQGMSSFEMQKDDGIRKFERVCRKYHVDYAVKKVKGDQPKYIIFFKGKDKDALTAAFSEFMQKSVRNKKRIPLKDRLAKIMPSFKSQDHQKDRNRERSL